MLEPGDWVEGDVKWWWKYVLPSQEVFWATVVAQQATLVSRAPEQGSHIVSEAMQAVAMLTASARVTDTAVASRLRNEAADKLRGASEKIQNQKTARV